METHIYKNDSYAFMFDIIKKESDWEREPIELRRQVFELVGGTKKVKRIIDETTRYNGFNGLEKVVTYEDIRQMITDFASSVNARRVWDGERDLKS